MEPTVRSKLLRYRGEVELDPKGHRRPTKRAALAMADYLYSGAVLGEGKFSKVLEAVDCSKGVEGGKVAAKVIDLVKAHPRVREFCVPRETQLWANLKHDNIVALLHSYQSATYIVLISEFIPGGNLLEFINDHNGVGESVGHTMVRGLYDAVKYLHDKDVAHRDIKLENIMMDGNRLKLTDFGLSRALDDGNSLEDNYTICGTRPYCCPQLLQFEPYQPRMADVWSLGVVIHAFITGSLPFDPDCHGYSMAKMIQLQLGRQYGFPEGISKDFQQLIHSHLTCAEANRPTIHELCQSRWVKLGPPKNPNQIKNGK